MRLVDYKVRVITSPLKGTASLVRVLITSSDGQAQWGTVGLSANIVEASWRALVDSVEYKLGRDHVAPITDDEEAGSDIGAERRVKEAIR
jgi:2-isopropylmalate synthase